MTNLDCCSGWTVAPAKALFGTTTTTLKACDGRIRRRMVAAGSTDSEGSRSSSTNNTRSGSGSGSSSDSRSRSGGNRSL